jgi:hypothetical protein
VSAVCRSGAACGSIEALGLMACSRYAGTLDLARVGVAGEVETRTSDRLGRGARQGILTLFPGVGGSAVVRGGG